ncbi:MAG: hypothetical protein ACK5P7_00645 [Bdellovibrio sp.]
MHEKSRKTRESASYINRLGQEYFVHQGMIKTGKPKYFASQKRDGALARLPDGFVFGESINGIVTIQRPKSMLVPAADLDLVKQSVAKFQHLKSYRVEPKGKAILIYAPMAAEHMTRSIQYEPVLKFTFDPSLGEYQVERRCYRGEEHWLTVGYGKLEKMLKQFVRHIGKESFFELM